MASHAWRIVSALIAYLMASAVMLVLLDGPTSIARVGVSFSVGSVAGAAVYSVLMRSPHPRPGR